MNWFIFTYSVGETSIKQTLSIFFFFYSVHSAVGWDIGNTLRLDPLFPWYDAVLLTFEFLLTFSTTRTCRLILLLSLLLFIPITFPPLNSFLWEPAFFWLRRDHWKARSGRPLTGEQVCNHRHSLRSTQLCRSPCSVKMHISVFLMTPRGSSITVPCYYMPLL